MLTAIAADEDCRNKVRLRRQCDERRLTIPPFVSRNETKVFTLCFSALAYTPAYTALKLVRCADALVPLL